MELIQKGAAYFKPHGYTGIANCRPPLTNPVYLSTKLVSIDINITPICHNNSLHFVCVCGSGDMCNCCGPGSRHARCGACCMGTFGLGQAAGFSSDDGCRRWCCFCCRKKPKSNEVPKVKWYCVK